MVDRSRRNVLLQVSVGAATATAAAVLPGSPAEASPPRAGSGPVSGEPLTAYVRDPRVGEISIFVGTEEIVLVDRELTRRLGRAVHQARTGRQSAA